MVRPIDVKWKGSATVNYCVCYVTLSFDLTHDPELGFLKVLFCNSCISGIVGMIDVQWKGNELISYWADCMALPRDHTHDLNLEVSRSEFEIALSLEGTAYWHGTKGIRIVHSWPWYWLCVTMVGWADVPDNDRGAVDISRFQCDSDLMLILHSIYAKLNLTALDQSNPRKCVPPIVNHCHIVTKYSHKTICSRTVFLYMQRGIVPLILCR